ncbi:MAG: polysaccharide biosynthesis protein [Lachnospiraceae bacterium]|nr:polysaccharide biosynthesis protein [Lachnospiraceae bacterium]
MGQNSKRDGFVMQAGILAMAGIIVRIIGILYRSPLTGIIGDEGNGYYSSAYNIYTIILLISSYSIPSAISKVIAQRLALREYRNAHRIFHCAIIYVVIVGGIASLFTFFGAGLLVEDNCEAVLRVFAPTIFLSGLLGVLRGYFQAHRTMLQTSVSQIIEQILNAVVSLLAAHLLIQTVVAQSETTQAIYGAIGSALGTGSGVLIALLFMWAVYGLNRKLIIKRVRNDVRHDELSYGQIFGIIFGMVTPFILSTFIYNFSTSLNQTIYTKVMKYVMHLAESEIAVNYGVFAGKAVVISNIPIAIASSMSAAMIPSISASYAQGNKEKTHHQVHVAVQTTMLISIPCAFGMMALAQPITELLFPQKESLALASALLRAISISVIFYALSTLTNAVLQGVGKVNAPVLNAAVALIVQTVVLVLLLAYTDLSLYALAIAMVVYSLLMCLLNNFVVRRALGYRQEMIKTFIKPTLSAIVMGVAAYYVYKVIYMFAPVNLIALLPSIFVAVILYFTLVIKTGALSEEELAHIPKGGMIVRVAKKLHLL